MKLNRWAIVLSSSAKSPRAGRTAGGIVLPDSAKDKPSRGTVIAVGDGRMLDDGTRHKLQVKPGRRVRVLVLRRREVQGRRQKLLLMREEDILAVIEG